MSSVVSNTKDSTKITAAIARNTNIFLPIAKRYLDFLPGLVPMVMKEKTRWADF